VIHLDDALRAGALAPCTISLHAALLALANGLLLQLPRQPRRKLLAQLLLLALLRELLPSHLRNGSTHLRPIQQRPPHQIQGAMYVGVIHRPLEHSPPSLHRGRGWLLVPAAEHLKEIVLQGHRHILRTNWATTHERIESPLDSIGHGALGNEWGTASKTQGWHCSMSCKL
jgi:hypothetical protein